MATSRQGGFVNASTSMRDTMAQGENKCRQPTIHSLSESRLILRCALGNLAFAVTGSPFNRFWSGSQVAHPRNKFWPIIPSLNRTISVPCTPTLPNWRRGAKLRKDEASVRREPFAQAGITTGRLVSWVRKRNILDFATARGFILVSTDSDFELLARQISGAKVVILRSCNYPTAVAAEVLRRNAIRVAELLSSQDSLIVLGQ